MTSASFLADHAPLASARPRTPAWYWVAAVLGLAWSAFGMMQFVDSLRSTPESLEAMGMTAEQARMYGSYPVWMTIAFAIGVGGGVLGCAMLLARRAVATPVLIASLVGYLVLYVGDITEGVFAALGAPQVAILSFVVLVAAALVLLARSSNARGLLR